MKIFCLCKGDQRKWKEKDDTMQIAMQAGAINDMMDQMSKLLNCE